MRTKFKLWIAGASLGLVVASFFAAAKPRADEQPIVRIHSGKVEGKFLESGVTAYLGVPYAAPPVRELRWKDPQPVVHWNGTFHADRFGPQCMQPQRGLLTNQYSGAEITSEDCLYLNVWTAPTLKKAPVIVYVHGGGFFIGAASMPLYGGEVVASEGAVFVNFNYRTGALGFMAHPALSAESPHKTSGNYGLLDQVAALKWVRGNIAQFGGDPDNVTIVGQSAGSMSVLLLQASPLTKGLIHRAVGMSGGLGAGPGATPALAEAENEGVKLQNYLKAADLGQLRAMPADRIVVPRTPDGPRISANQDGYFLQDTAEGVFAAGKQNDVPLLLGFTQDESFGGFGPVGGLEDYRAKVASRFGDRAEAFLGLYPANTDEEAKSQARAADRDGTTASGMARWAEAQLQHGRGAVFTYQFSRAHTYTPGISFTDLDPATAGAYHTSEVPFWLGTLDSFNRYRATRNWSADDRAFSLMMTRSLVAFAKNGNPSTSDITWPAYDPQSPSLVDFGVSARVSAWPDRRKFEFFQSAPRRTSSGGSLRD
jgi:para-nitrobenzyl esterase